MKHPDRFFAGTIRLRSEGTDHLLAAAEATGVSHVVAQSFGAFDGIREGGWVKTEEDPLDLLVGTAAQVGMEALGHVEDVVVKAGGAVLRYGAFYGPGAIDDQVTLVRKRQYPLVGGGAGYSSWVHLDDAASATVLAVEQKARAVECGDEVVIARGAEPGQGSRGQAAGSVNEGMAQWAVTLRRSGTLGQFR